MRLCPFLIVAMLALVTLSVPTMQLMSPAAANVVHQVSAKTGGTTSGGSRICAVAGAVPVPARPPVETGRLVPVDSHESLPGFSAAPFVPPRA